MEINPSNDKKEEISLVTSEIKIFQWRGEGRGALPEENRASEKCPPDCTLHPACNSRNTENGKKC
jgi:hypothetical protein